MTRTVTETITIAGLLNGFDPEVHTEHLVQLIVDRHGPGWALISIIDGVATAQRTVTIEDPPVTAEALSRMARVHQLRDAARRIREAGHLGGLLVGDSKHDNLKWAVLNTDAGTLTYRVEVPFVHDGRRYSKGQEFVHHVIEI